MIISSNSNGSSQEFESLLSNTTIFLSIIAERHPEYYSTRGGIMFEEDVLKAMIEKAKDSQFEGTIFRTSVRSFPDIVAKEFYGVEVKTSSKGQPWKCVGNSVLETSRVESVQKIYIFFGKISPSPPEFRFKKYEDCLYEVAVTHSPRYMVDMDIPDGSTIFDKLGISYEELRSNENPIRPIMDYYRQNLQQGEDLWWLGFGEPERETSNVTIKFWRSLPNIDKCKLRCQMMALFPEVLSKGMAGDDKYGRAAFWLIKKKSIVCSSFRDVFTGGGNIELRVGGRVHAEIPKIFKRVIKGNILQVLVFFEDMPDEEVEFYWGRNIPRSERRETWLTQFRTYCSEWLEGKTLDIEELLQEELGGEAR